MFKTITERKNENIKYFFFLNTVLHDMYFTTTVVLHICTMIFYLGYEQKL